MWAAPQAQIAQRRCIANCGKQPQQSPLVMGGVAMLANEELGPGVLDRRRSAPCGRLHPNPLWYGDIKST